MVYRVRFSLLWNAYIYRVQFTDETASEDCNMQLNRSGVAVGDTLARFGTVVDFEIAQLHVLSHEQ